MGARRLDPRKLIPADLPHGLPDGQKVYGPFEHPGSYGDFENQRDGRRYYADAPFDSLYFVPELLSGSDYSGSSVTLANYREFLAEFDKLPGVFPLVGGCGTYAVAIRADVLCGELSGRRAELLETLEALTDYPCIDEESVSEVENEAEHECWASYGARDFADHVGELIARLFGAGNILDDLDIPAAGDDTLSELYRALCELSNDYPEHEEGGGVFFPMPGTDSSGRWYTWKLAEFADILGPWILAHAAKVGEVATVELSKLRASLAEFAADTGADAAVAVLDSSRTPFSDSTFARDAARLAASAGIAALALGADAKGFACERGRSGWSGTSGLFPRAGEFAKGY